MLISLVCHGNIARSQVLHHYLVESLRQKQLDNIEVFSCGTADRNDYANVAELLSDVEKQLQIRGLSAKVRRNHWSPESIEKLLESDFVLVADSERKQDILTRLKGQIDENRVFLFYEFIGEGEKDFTDTYDHSAGRQDPQRYTDCFDELQYLAGKISEKLGSGNFVGPVNYYNATDARR